MIKKMINYTGLNKMFLYTSVQANTNLLFLIQPPYFIASSWNQKLNHHVVSRTDVPMNMAGKHEFHWGGGGS